MSNSRMSPPRVPNKIALELRFEVDELFVTVQAVKRGCSRAYVVRDLAQTLEHRVADSILWLDGIGRLTALETSIDAEAAAP